MGRLKFSRELLQALASRPQKFAAKQGEMLMPDPSSEINPLDELAEEFVERYRRGERPPLTEYIERHPGLADEIRDLFPGLVLMEGIRPEAGEATGGYIVRSTSTQLERLGDYRILREVARGGMGIVYEAEQVSLGRHVALKVLPQGLLMDSKAKRRFEREAKSAARLHHTNIVPVFGVGEQDGLPYYVMQFIQGLGLDEVLDELKKLQLANPKSGTVAAGGELRVSTREMSAVHVARSLLTGDFQRPFGEPEPEDEAMAPTKPQAPPEDPPAPTIPRMSGSSDTFRLSSSSVMLPGQSRDNSKSKNRKQTYWQSVAHIGVQVADALEYAHKQGILHRDIKPSNLLLDTQGTVWVTDFGLAKTDDRQNLTHTGDILGTLRYMPPEAFEAKTDARSDVYSLGLTLYEMLAFRPAFDEKERNRLVKQVTTQEAERLTNLNRQVPQDLDTIIHKSIEKDPKLRYATAAAFAADLQRFIDDEPIEARRTSRLERCWRWCRHNPAIAGLAASVVFCLMLGTAVASYFAVVANQRAASEGLERERADEKATEAEMSARMAYRQVYATDMNLAQIAWEDARINVARDRLARHLPQLDREDWRGFEWHYWDRLCHLELSTLKGHTRWVRAAAWSPDGTRILSCSTDSTAKVWDASSGRELLTLTWEGANSSGPQGQTSTVGWSSDGKQIVGGARGLKIWDATTGREVLTSKGSTQWIGSVAWSPDGRHIASGNGDKTIRIWDAKTGEELRTLKGHAQWVNNVAWSPDSQRIVSGSGDKTLKIWDTVAGRELLTLKGHSQWINGVSWSHDGKRIASASGDRTVKIWDAATGHDLLTLRGHTRWVRGVAWSPDNQRVVSGGGDETVRIWDAETGQETLSLKGHTNFIGDVDWSRDGRRIVSGGGDKTLKIWSASSGQETLTCRGHTQGVPGLAWSPDGAWIVSASRDKTARVWDTASGRAIRTLQGHSGGVTCVAWSPDGRFIATGSEDKTGKIWDGATGKDTLTLQGHKGGVIAMAWSPDGTRLVTGGSDSSVRVWDATTGQTILELPRFGTAARDVAWSPDGRHIAAPAERGGLVWIWDATTGQRALTLRGHTGFVRSVAWSPNGSRLATAGLDMTLRVWDATTGQETLRMQGHSDFANTVAWSRDGLRLVSGSGDTTVKVWDATTGQEILTLKVHTMPVVSVAWCSDGRRIASASEDGIVKVWESQPVAEDVLHRRELVSRVFSLFAEIGSREGVLAELGKDVRLSEADRQFASEAAQTFSDLEIQQIRVQRIVKQAQTHTEEKQWKEAAETYARAAELKREDSYLWLESGRAAANIEEWEQVAQAFAKALALLPEDPSSTAGRASPCVELAEWDKAFARVVELRPKDQTLWLGRARYHAKRSQWEQAAADFARAVALKPPHYHWIEHACALLLTGHGDTYRQFCATAGEQADKSVEPFTAYILARTCALSPDSGVEPERIVTWARQAVTADRRRAEYLHALSAALYRAGQFTQVIDTLEDAGDRMAISDQLILAMTHFRLGHADEAHKQLDNAISDLEAMRPKSAENPVELPSADWMEAHIMCREARALIGEKAPPATRDAQ
jgi:WD40 repeat protein/serine/threonine protein kinase/tetratricopeptide (TPR) repeat protein